MAVGTAIGQGRFGVIREGIEVEMEGFEGTLRRLALKELKVDAKLCIMDWTLREPTGLQQAINKVASAKRDLELAVSELEMLYSLREQYPDAHICYPINHGE